MTIDERMTICNMSIEGGARAGYVNPDETTFAFLRGRRFAPQGDAFDRAVDLVAAARVRRGRRLRRPRARSTPRRSSRPSPGASIPGQSVGIGESIAGDADEEALAFMGFERGARVRGHADRRRLHRLVHQRPAVGPRGSGARRPRPPRRRRTSRRWSCPARRRCAARRGGARAARDLHERPASNGAAPAARCAWR